MNRRRVGTVVAGGALAAAAATTGVVTQCQSGPSSCSARADETAAVQTQIDTTPDGGTLTLERRCYHLDGTLAIVDRHGLTINGNGATLQRFAHSDQRLARNLFVSVSDHITIQGVSISSDKPDTIGYVPSLEGQAGLQVDQSSNVTIDGLGVAHTYGDNVYVDGSSDVTFTGGTWSQAGRQGLALVSGARITVQGVTIESAHRHDIDTEPNRAEDILDQVTFKANTLRWPNLSYLSGMTEAGCDPDPASPDCHFNVTNVTWAASNLEE